MQRLISHISPGVPGGSFQLLVVNKNERGARCWHHFNLSWIDAEQDSTGQALLTGEIQVMATFFFLNYNEATEDICSHKVEKLGPAS